MEAESAARLMIEGEILYGADTRKLNGYGYCSLSYGLADSGELRQAIRMASKALYLGQTGGDRCLVALAKRDLANAYSFAGELDRAEAFATQAIQGASSCGGVSNATTLANKRAIFIIRSSGAVTSGSSGMWSGGVESSTIGPGDTIVVPERAVVGSSVWKNLVAIAQVAQAGALAAAVAIP